MEFSRSTIFRNKMKIEAEKRQRVNQSLLKRKMAKPSKEDIEK